MGGGEGNRKVICFSVLNSSLSKNHPFPPFGHPSPHRGEGLEMGLLIDYRMQKSLGCTLRLPWGVKGQKMKGGLQRVWAG